MPTQVMRRLCEGLSTLIMIVCVVILSSLIVINSLEITLRSFFGISFSWIYETNTLLAAWLYFLGIVVVYHHAKDITVTFLIDALPPRVRIVYLRGIQLLSGGVFLACAWYSWRLIQLQWPFHTPGVGYPRAAFTAPLLIGLVLIALECLRRVFETGEPDAADKAPGAAS